MTPEVRLLREIVKGYMTMVNVINSRREHTGVWISKENKNLERYLSKYRPIKAYPMRRLKWNVDEIIGRKP